MTALQQDVQTVPAGTSHDGKGGLNGGLCHLQLEAASTDPRVLVPKQSRTTGPRTDFKEPRMYVRESNRECKLKGYEEEKMGLGYLFLALRP